MAGSKASPVTLRLRVGAALGAGVMTQDEAAELLRCIDTRERMSAMLEAVNKIAPPPKRQEPSCLCKMERSRQEAVMDEALNAASISLALSGVEGQPGLAFLAWCQPEAPLAVAAQGTADDVAQALTTASLMFAQQAAAKGGG